MAKYICLEKELEISKYQQLKRNGFEIVYASELSILGNPDPRIINQIETYNCFNKICVSLRKSGLNTDYHNMLFGYVYDIGQISDLQLALTLKEETEINLRLDISFEDLEVLAEDVNRLADKYLAAIIISSAIRKLNDEVSGYLEIIDNEIDLSELQIIKDIDNDLQDIMRRHAYKIYNLITEHEHTPTA